MIKKSLIYFILICINFDLFTIDFTDQEIDFIINNPQEKFVYLDIATRKAISEVTRIYPDNKFSKDILDTLINLNIGHGFVTQKAIAQNVLSECLSLITADDKCNSDLVQTLKCYQEGLDDDSARIIVEQDENQSHAITRGKKKVLCRLAVKDCLKVCGTLVAKKACISNLVVSGNEVINGNLTVKGQLIIDNASFVGPKGDTGATGATGATGTNGTLSVTGPNNAIALFDGAGSLKPSSLSPVSIDASNNVSQANDITMSGDLNLAHTSGPSVGVVTKGGSPFIHDFGTANFFAGANAGNFSMSGGSNIGIGPDVLTSNASGITNVAIGGDALFSNTDGSQNIAIGESALANNTIGTDNVGVGASALSLNIDGLKNVAIGSSSLLNITAGDSNTAIGTSTLQSLTAGGQNIALGFFAGANTTSGSNNIYIGNFLTVPGAESNAIRVGQSGTQTDCYIQGIFGQPVAGSGIPVQVDAVGKLGTTVSSARYKENIKDMNAASSKILKLRPVVFNYNKTLDKEGSLQYGLIAEEVEKIDKDLVVYKDGKPESVKYHVLNALLLNELQKLYKRVEALEKAKK